MNIISIIMLLFKNHDNKVTKKLEFIEERNVGNLASKYINVIETNYLSNNFNIFIVFAELPALVSILKRFTIYFIISLVIVNCIFIGIYSFNWNDFISTAYVFDVNNFFDLSNTQVFYFPVTSLVIYIKFLLVLYLNLNIFLFVFYYLHSFLLLQKYNSVSKFRGNDVIPDTLDFESDGIKQVMWKI